MQLASSSAPGKLYLAGEYAVVHAGNPSLVIAVDRYVHVRADSVDNVNDVNNDCNKTVGAGAKQWHITSEQFPDTIALCGRSTTTRRLFPTVYTDALSFAQAAAMVADTYAQHYTQQTITVALTIASRLQSDDGRKLGLGSSAAVCVAVVRAVLQAYGITADALVVYKLAALAHFAMQGNGSLGDIAASSMGGVVYYRSCDRTWLARATGLQSLLDSHAPAQQRLEQLATIDVYAIVQQAWPLLVIEPVRVDPTVHIIVGWTGSPASTKDLVARAARPVEPAAYQAFLEQSAQSVDALRAELEHPQGTGTLQNIVAQLRSQLLQLAQLRDVPIETPTLAAGINAACAQGMAAKSSGAGGGDCFIAIYNSGNANRTDNADSFGKAESTSSAGYAGVSDSLGKPEAQESSRSLEQVYAIWKAQGIVPLDLHVSEVYDA